MQLCAMSTKGDKNIPNTQSKLVQYAQISLGHDELKTMLAIGREKV